MSLEHAKELEAAGQGPAAAAAYQAAAGELAPAEAQAARLRAGLLLLADAQVTAGLEVLRAVLEGVGEKLPSGGLADMAGALARMAWVRLGGVGAVQRAASDVPIAAALRADALWGATLALYPIDPVLSLATGTRYQRAAKRAGDAARIGRALSLEAWFRATASAESQADDLLDDAAELARSTRDPYLAGLVPYMRGTLRYLDGRWIEGQRDYELGAARFAEIPGALIEQTSTRALGALCRLQRGDLAGAREGAESLLAEARARGDVFSEFLLDATLRWFLFLCDDAPQRGDEVLASIARWDEGVGRSAHFSLWSRLNTSTSVALYRGEVERAWAIQSAEWPALARSIFMRIRFAAHEAHFLRGRAALASAQQAAPEARRPFARVAASMARRLERAPEASARAWGAVVRAGLHRLRGEARAAREAELSACASFEQLDMQLHLGAARWRLATGEQERAAAEAALRERGVVAPARLCALLGAQPPPQEGT